MQSIQLSIPTPCHQNWDNMSPTQQGRFCNACAKQVVDFTSMSDGEVLNYFLNKKEENVCGRTLPNQLERVLEAPKPITHTKLWYWKYAAASLLFFSKEANAQTNNNHTIGKLIPTNALNVNSSNVKDTLINTSKVLHGKITDEDGNAIPFASIYIKGTRNGVVADAKGNYSIKINSENDVLEIISTGFQHLIVSLIGSTNTNFTLKRVNHLTGEMVVTTGILIRKNADDFTQIYTIQNHIAIVKVKDAETGKNIENALLLVDKNYTVNSNFTNKEGEFKIKKIKKDEQVNIIIKASGYEDKEVIIFGKDFEYRKEVKEILLRKKQNSNSNEIAQKNTPTILPNSNGLISASAPKLANGGTVVRMGQVSSSIMLEAPVIYVVDGVIIKNADDYNPDDIEDIEVLQGAAASAIYGLEGRNGAIILTTKKKKAEAADSTFDVKTLPNILLRSATMGKITRRSCSESNVTIGAILETVTVTLTKLDTIKSKIQNLFSPIKLYPNPVQKNDLLNVLITLKNNENYVIQITNSLGAVVSTTEHKNNLLNKAATQIQLNEGWSSGIYFLSILNSNKKVLASSSFIVK